MIPCLPLRRCLTLEVVLHTFFHAMDVDIHLVRSYTCQFGSWHSLRSLLMERSPTLAHVCEISSFISLFIAREGLSPFSSCLLASFAWVE
jgi:hypothetical protein